MLHSTGFPKIEYLEILNSRIGLVISVKLCCRNSVRYRLQKLMKMTNYSKNEYISKFYFIP